MTWHTSGLILWNSPDPSDRPLLQVSHENSMLRVLSGYVYPALTCLPCRLALSLNGVRILIGLRSLARWHKMLSLLCRLAALPQSVSALTRLQWLALSHNVIAELPGGLGCLTNLRRLDLRSNRLRELPEELGGASSLQELDASENALEQLPKSLAQLKLLRTLLLDKNRWVYGLDSLHKASLLALMASRPENGL